MTYVSPDVNTIIGTENPDTDTGENPDTDTEKKY